MSDLRAIVIFPDPPDIEAIQAVRRDYDPLAALVPPHLTLVFPFASDLSEDALAEHMRQSVQGVDPFALRVAGVTGSGDEYLFLNVKHGNDELIALHDRLYTGPLVPYLEPRFAYTPHMTIGRITDSVTFARALAEARARLPGAFETTVRAIATYRIGADDERTIESTVAL